MPPRVVYWTNIPAPYMVERFDALARRGRLDFEAWFSARTNRDRSWSVDEREWSFPYRYLPSVGRGEYPWALPTPLVTKPLPDVVVMLHAAPSFILGSALLRLRAGRLAFWIEPTHDAVVTRRRWKDALKVRLFRGADAILTTGSDGRRFASRYGAPVSRTFVVPHVVDAAFYARESSLSEADRWRLRDELGVSGLTFLYVGRLLAGKGLRDLVEAFVGLQASTSVEVSLLIVGDGPEEAALREQCRRRGGRGVVFAGFRERASLPRVYAASDVFVFPTLGDTFGMVVSEAMACGLPVIATSSSGEIRDRVDDGVNGFIVPPSDPAVLQQRMSVLAGDAELRARMGEASRARIAGESPQLWASAFETAIERILELPPAPPASVICR